METAEDRAKRVREFNFEALVDRGAPSAAASEGISLSIGGIPVARTRAAFFFCALAVTCTVLLGAAVQQQERQLCDRPLFLVYVVHLDSLLLIVPLLYWHFWRRPQQLSESEPGAAAALWDVFWHCPRSRWAGVALAFLLFAGEWLWYVSLPKISVSASLGIANSAPSWTLLLSMVLLGEGITVATASAVLCCLLGVVLVACSGAPPAGVGSPALGYFSAVLSAMALSAFLVVFKRWGAGAVRNEQLPSAWHGPIRRSFVLLFAVGAWNLVACWPLVVLWNLLGIETFSLPSLTVVLTILAVQSADLVVSVSMVLAVQIASPFFVSVSLLFVVPLAMLVDAIIHQYVVPAVGVIGLCFVCAGLLAIAWFEWYLVSHSAERERADPTAQPLWKRVLFREYRLSLCRRADAITASPLVLP